MPAVGHPPAKTVHQRHSTVAGQGQEERRVVRDRKVLRETVQSLADTM